MSDNYGVQEKLNICGAVYVIGPKDGFYKIGYSKQFSGLEQRLKAQIEPEMLLIALFLHQNADWLEQMLHILFVERRVFREWFALTEADLELLSQHEPVGGEHLVDLIEQKHIRLSTQLFDGLGRRRK